MFIKHLIHRSDKSIIRQLRELTQISQYELAHLFSVGQSFISRLESRKRKLSVEQAYVLISFAERKNILIDIEDLAKDYLIVYRKEKD
jgi:transcriptional regulator with XRE-family HTH domain